MEAAKLALDCAYTTNRRTRKAGIVVQRATRAPSGKLAAALQGA